MSRTLEEAIKHAEYIASKYSGAVSVCWSANDNRQLAAWLRELQERRKAPEIIRCGECKYIRRWINTNHQFCDITACKVSKDEFCNRAERETDND